MGTVPSNLATHSQSDACNDLPESMAAPIMTRQLSVPDVIMDETDNNQSSSVYSSKYHTIITTMDIHKPLPIYVLGTPMDSTIILDETGSMFKLGNEPVESIDGYILGQKNSGFDVNMTIVRFNEHIRFTLPLSVRDSNLKITDYHPEGMTALFDAIAYGILSATKAQNMTILTDGEDNSSILKLSVINDLIKRAESCGWIFTFIGCTREAYEQGTQFKMASEPIYTDSCKMDMEGAPPPPSLFKALSQVSDKVTEMNHDNTK